MSTDELKNKVESLLFVSDEPVTALTLATILKSDISAVSTCLEDLKDEYESQSRGFQLREIAGGWRLYSNPSYHELIEEYILSWDTRKLSQAALEALAVIAYRQPVTRNGVNAVRGVNSEAVIGSLLEKGLIRDVGREKALGNAILYGTTTTFLEKFGLSDINELPPIEQFEPRNETEEAIRDRLDANLDRLHGDDEVDDGAIERAYIEADDNDGDISIEAEGIDEEGNDIEVIE